jgi:hypothetical protein
LPTGVSFSNLLVGGVSGLIEESAVREHINRAIWADPHIADSRAKLGQERFFRDNLIVDDRQPIEHRSAKATDKKAVLPRRKQISCVEREDRRRDDGSQ